MKFTTGVQEITSSTFIVLRDSNDIEMILDYNIEETDQVWGRKSFFANVPAKKVKIGESIYNSAGTVIGYRCQ